LDEFNLSAYVRRIKQGTSVLGKLILIFVFVPLTDLILLMMLSSYTGWPFSVAMVILSGILGAYLAKRSWMAVGVKIRQRMAHGQMSPDLLTDGAMILFAAGLLLTPGFITDAVGLSLLIPACRRWYKTRVTNWMKRNFKIQVVQMPTMNDPNTVDGDVVRDEASETDDGPKVIESGELLQ
jgi:UPF0716 protein FxsA